MECKRALLADYVFETKDGKLSAIGLFDVVIVPDFPATHPAMGVALQLQFHGGEAPRHTVQVRLVDQDGRQLVPELRADLVVQERITRCIMTLLTPTTLSWCQDTGRSGST